MRIGFPTTSLRPRPGRTLAVVSCALALLAAHPLVGRSAATETPAAVRTVNTPSRPAIAWLDARANETPTLAARPSEAAEVQAQESRKTRAGSSLVVCLTRFLVAHLMPVAAPQVLPALAPVRLDEPPVLIANTFRAGVLYPDLPPPSERCFALARHLLAPPC